MDKEIIKDTFSIIKTLKNNEIFDSDFDSQINLLFSVISEGLYSQNIDTAKTVKKVIEDKLLHQDTQSMKSFYLGKLSGLSQLIGQIKQLIDFEVFADNLSDKEVNSLLYLFIRGEVVNEVKELDEENCNEHYLTEESSSNWRNLENKNLIISHQFSYYNLQTLSFKGNEVINLLHKKKKISLNNFDMSYHKYDIENQGNSSIKIDFHKSKIKKNSITIDKYWNYISDEEVEVEVDLKKEDSSLYNSLWEEL